VQLLKSDRGEIIITVAVITMAVMYAIAVGFRLYPIFLHQQQLNTYANELCRVAEISGRVGPETQQEQEKLNQTMHLEPQVSWSTTGKVQLNDDITVTCSLTEHIDLFGGLGSIPITLHSTATGQSEVYWK
jgi:hypothetical protein